MNGWRGGRGMKKKKPVPEGARIVGENGPNGPARLKATGRGGSWMDSKGSELFH